IIGEDRDDAAKDRPRDNLLDRNGDRRGNGLSLCGSAHVHVCSGHLCLSPQEANTRRTSAPLFARASRVSSLRAVRVDKLSALPSLTSQEMSLELLDPPQHNPLIP